MVMEPMFCGKKVLSFQVLGNPHGLERARFSSKNGRSYNPPGNVQARANIQAIATMEMERQEIALMHSEMPVELIVRSYRPIPNGKPKWYKNAAKLGLLVPLTKPDNSNILKEIEDALNGVVYVDDKQIFKISCESGFSEQPRLEVEVIGYFINVGDVKQKISQLDPKPRGPYKKKKEAKQ